MILRSLAIAALAILPASAAVAGAKQAPPRIDAIMKARGAKFPNLDRKDAFVVKHGFKQVYESTTHPESHGRLMAKVLGAPMDEEHADTRAGALPGQVIQRFERGYLTWDTQRGVRVRLPAFADDIPK